MISHCPRQPDQTKDYFARDEAWAEGQEAASVSSESHGTLRQASFFYSLSPRLEDTRPFLAGDPGRGPGCSLSWLPRQCLLGLPSFLIRTLGTASNSLSLSPGSRRGQPPPVYNAHVLPATPVRPPRFSLRVVSDLGRSHFCSLAPWLRGATPLFITRGSAPPTSLCEQRTPACGRSCGRSFTPAAESRPHGGAGGSLSRTVCHGGTRSSMLPPAGPFLNVPDRGEVRWGEFTAHA